MPFDIEQLKTYPKGCGVYLMKDDRGHILYVGKAIDLRSRLKQYFLQHDERAMVPYLIALVETIDVILVSNEKEALILENNLIKEHKPRYNACLKDDKSYFSLMINHKHKWPMLRVVRYKGRPPSDALYFGPYTKGYAARETLELLRRLFPLRQCSDRELVSRNRPCILYDLKRCIAPCVGKCSEGEYESLVQRVIAFLRGHDATILKDLTQEMEKAADSLEFERAEAIHALIQNIEVTLEKQAVQKPTRKDLDVIGFARNISGASLVVLFFREGRLMGSTDHFFPQSVEEDEEIISSFILQNYQDKEFYPEEILSPLSLNDQESITELISESAKQRIQVITPKIGEKRELLEMARINALAKLERYRDTKEVKEMRLIALEEELQLINYPEEIECIDNSNIGGTDQVSALVAYSRGVKNKSKYRKYKLEKAKAYDDYSSLREVLLRRFKRAKEEDTLPDLLLIDGGRGHLKIALEVLSELDISTVDLIAIAKESSKHTRGITLERLYQPNLEGPVLLKGRSPTLLFLQEVRDEAHRFALSFQKKRRSKRILSSSLLELPGIGPIKRERLLKTFKSIPGILEATDEELLSVPGISKKDIEILRKNLKSAE